MRLDFVHNHMLGTISEFFEKCIHKSNQGIDSGISCIRNLPQNMQQNQIVAFSVFFFANAIFFTMIKYLADYITKANVERNFKSLLFDMALVGSSVFAFNVVVSKVLQYPLSRSSFVALTSSIVCLRIILNLVGDDLKDKKKINEPVKSPKEGGPTEEVLTQPALKSVSNTSSNVFIEARKKIDSPQNSQSKIDADRIQQQLVAKAKADQDRLDAAAKAKADKAKQEADRIKWEVEQAAIAAEENELQAVLRESEEVANVIQIIKMQEEEAQAAIKAQNQSVDKDSQLSIDPAKDLTGKELSDTNDPIAQSTNKDPIGQSTNKENDQSAVEGQISKKENSESPKDPDPIVQSVKPDIDQSID